MKLRSDFVTNSSSSSFIIAKHKDCTRDEVKDMLNTCRKDILFLLHDYEGEVDCDYMSTIKEYYDNEEFDKAVDLAIECLTSDLMNTDLGSMTLDNWTVSSEYASNEDAILFAGALYEFGWNMSTDHLRVMRGE
jgi:hypothetical protein